MKNADEPIILIVDDNLENLFILQSDLQNMGYVVKQTQSPEQAILFTKQFQFSLIILDVEMPEVNGFELFGKIREVPNNRDIPVLFLSANRIQRNQNQKIISRWLERKRNAFNKAS